MLLADAAITEYMSPRIRRGADKSPHFPTAEILTLVSKSWLDGGSALI